MFEVQWIQLKHVLLNRTRLWYIYRNASLMMFSSKPNSQNTKILIYHMAPLSAENIFPIIFLLLTTFSVSKAELHAHYYDQICPQFEKIISETVLKASKHDPKVPARILRMFFHDCFIRVWSFSEEKHTHMHCMCTQYSHSWMIKGG